MFDMLMMLMPLVKKPAARRHLAERYKGQRQSQSLPIVLLVDRVDIIVVATLVDIPTSPPLSLASCVVAVVVVADDAFNLLEQRAKFFKISNSKILSHH
jgi:hypothetical protein